MRHFFGIRGPEVVGVGILGATIGAVACGAGLAGQQGHVLLGAACGAMLVPALFVAPWGRLRRRPRGVAMEGSNLV